MKSNNIKLAMAIAQDWVIDGKTTDMIETGRLEALADKVGAAEYNKHEILDLAGAFEDFASAIIRAAAK